MSVRAKAYMATLPASYTEDDLGKIGSWSLDNCFRAAIVKTDDDHAVWVAIRERTRTKGDWLRHIRGVFSAALRLDVRPLAGGGCLALCVGPKASEIIRAASSTTCRAAPKEDDTTQEDDTRDILMPSAHRRAAVGSSIKRTSPEIVKTP